MDSRRGVIFTKHFVFLVGSYYPYSSAVGNCCFNIAEELAKECKTTVISMKSRIDQDSSEEFNGQKIIRISNKWFNYRLYINEKIKMNVGIKRKWYTFLLNIVRTKEYLLSMVSKTSLNKSWILSYRRALNSINESIDVIIPFCFPMEAVVAGMEFIRQHDSIKLIPFIFDQFVESETLHRNKLNKIVKRKSNSEIEELMLEVSEAVICVNQLQEHFLKHDSYLKKLIIIEHPLVKEIRVESNKILYEKDEINLVYTGVFDKKIRNPQFFLEVMLIIATKIKVKLHLYTYGNCGQIIENYVRRSNSIIINYGQVSKDEANQAMLVSDILLCVGNVDNLQVPSKIFEYISAGKPIIYFYQVYEDVNVGILKDYPLCLCLKQDYARLIENAQKFVKFCRENKGKTLVFSEVEQIYFYATPKYIVGQISAVFQEPKSTDEHTRIAPDAG